MSLTLNNKQLQTLEKIKKFSELFNIDPSWAGAVALTESSLGMFQKSPTNARGVFQMTSIAMKDLLIEMEKDDSDLIDIACGVAFLYLLLKRWKSIKLATNYFCDPKDRHFYIDKVMKYKKELECIIDNSSGQSLKDSLEHSLQAVQRRLY